MIITASASFGLSAGAKAVNQAFSSSTGSSPGPGAGASGSGPSSAVPVLPATWASGMFAALPVPDSTLATIRSRTVFAISVSVTSVVAGSGPSAGSVTSGVGLRLPPAAIVCAADAICSGLASTWPCPIAVTATSSSEPIGSGMVEAGRSTTAVASAL